MVGPVPAALVARAALLGLAAGARASLGPCAAALTARDARPVVRVGAALGVLAELTGDKLPFVGSRLDGSAPVGRILSGTIGGVWLARRHDAAPVLPALAGAIGGAAGTWGGAAWRAWAGRRGPDWPAAVVEDAWALACAWLAVRPMAG